MESTNPIIRSTKSNCVETPEYVGVVFSNQANYTSHAGRNCPVRTSLIGEILFNQTSKLVSYLETFESKSSDKEPSISSQFVVKIWHNNIRASLTKQKLGQSNKKFPASNSVAWGKVGETA